MTLKKTLTMFGLRYKIFQLRLPTKVTRWFSDFLVGRVIQVKVDGFLSSKIYPKAGVPQGSVLSLLLFLTLAYGLEVKKASLAANRLQRDLDALAELCAKWRMKLNPEKPN